MTTLQEALLPCPFCGGPVKLELANVTRDNIYGDRHWYGVVCRNTTNHGGTCCMDQVPSASKEAAIARWNTRTALAQQGEQQPVAWYEYNQDLDAWFLAYGHNPKAKTRPLVFGDTAAPAPQPAQQVPATCVWTKDSDFEMGDTYDSSCGEKWSFIDGGPTENRVSFCQGCGKPVKLVQDIL